MDALKESALSGSGDALVQLGETARDDPTVFPHLIQVIRVFLNYLRLPGTADISSPEEFFTLLDRTTCFFHGLNVALQSPQAFEHSKMAGLLITCPKIYLWAVKFLHHYFIDANLPVSNLAVSATAVRIVELLNTLSADPDYCDKMRNTNGFVFSMTTLWMYGIRAGRGLIEEIVRMTMVHILQKRTLDNEVSDALNRVPNNIVEEICARVVASERDPDPDYDAGIMFLVISTMCSRSFTRAFISCGSVSWICRRIASIPARTAGDGVPDGPAGYAKLFQVSLVYLQRALKEGAGRIIEGLDADVIPMLLKVQSRLDADDREAALVPLLHLITSYTLYRNVLVKVWKVVYMSDLEPGISDAGPIGNGWKILKETTETRWEILKDYLASGRELTRCSYSACPPPDEGPKRALRRCEGCRFEYYCSKECQKLDWRDGHNEVCRTIQSCLKGLPMLMSKRERHFAYAIIDKDIEANAQLIQDLKLEKMRGAYDPTDLLTVTDYTLVPRKLYVITDEEFRKSENLPTEKWDAALELAKESGKDLVLSMIPQGTKAQALLDMYPFDFNAIVT
ncbi:uncharacterized protein EV420DRAFT_1146475 [Desarmillaria tabescens]|uniref:MYND-type domain-containing protein n=1 Tax=Armillaria tabescens TaxID=1929756 RepID=A0AA39NC86_ARMTA|nr:uncharacterized protein EV420DRAFT_1146475 [Desarmillaria tabescens]KAK0462950.1 hypothetical protein EV420DRAFT_1146475 [Desarmillaria tabescens]